MLLLITCVAALNQTSTDDQSLMYGILVVSMVSVGACSIFWMFIIVYGILVAIFYARNCFAARGSLLNTPEVPLLMVKTANRSKIGVIRKVKWYPESSGSGQGGHYGLIINDCVLVHATLQDGHKTIVFDDCFYDAIRMTQYGVSRTGFRIDTIDALIQRFEPYEFRTAHNFRSCIAFVSLCWGFLKDELMCIELLNYMDC